MGICSETVLKTVLIGQGRFSFYVEMPTQVIPFTLFTLSHQQVGWGCTRSWEGTHPVQMTPTDQRDVPHHVMSHLAIKSGGRSRKGGTFEVKAFVFQSNRYV